MKIRPAENLEEEEIERIVDKTFQGIIAEGKTDRKMVTTTELRKAINRMKNRKQDVRITGKQNR